jgi:hypothetical protein
MVLEPDWSWLGTTTVGTVACRLQGLDLLARYDRTELSGAFLRAQGVSLTLSGDCAGRFIRLRSG